MTHEEVRECDSDRDKFQRKVQKLVMGDSRDKDRADRRSGPTGPLSQRITIVCCQESLFSPVELLGKFDLATVESSSAAACADALAAILTIWRSDNTSSHPKDKAPSTSQDREVEKNMCALTHRVNHWRT